MSNRGFSPAVMYLRARKGGMALSLGSQGWQALEQHQRRQGLVAQRRPREQPPAAKLARPPTSGPGTRRGQTWCPARSQAALGTRLRGVSMAGWAGREWWHGGPMPIGGQCPLALPSQSSSWAEPLFSPSGRPQRCPAHLRFRGGSAGRQRRVEPGPAPAASFRPGNTGPCPTLTHPRPPAAAHTSSRSRRRR